MVPALSRRRFFVRFRAKKRRKNPVARLSLTTFPSLPILGTEREQMFS
jgi:hypothetical protein